jgi:hypothetical protein
LKATQISILLYGHNARLLESRKWALQSRGYRVYAILQLTNFEDVPLAPRMDLLVLCHTVTPKECAAAVACASARWPEIKKLALVRDLGKRPAGILSRVLQTLDGPNRLLSTVTELVGYAGSSSYSHTY